MPERSTPALSPQAESEITRHLEGLRAWRRPVGGAPEKATTEHELFRLAVSAVALLAGGLGVGILIGRML